MTRKSTTALFALLCLIAPAVADEPAAKPAEGVEKLAYRGWKDTYRLQNADCEATIVPGVGARLSRFSYRGKNVLLEDSAVDGLVMKPANRSDTRYWMPWDGCQPDMIDQTGFRQFYPVWMGAYSAKAEPFSLVAESIKQQVQQGDAHCVKTFALDRKEPRLKFGYKMTNQGTSAKSWTLLQRMVLATPGLLVVPLKKQSSFEGGFKMVVPYADEVTSSAIGKRALARIKQHIVTPQGDCLVVAPHMFGSKSRVFVIDRVSVQSDSDAGWLAWIVGDAAFVLSFPRPAGAAYATPNVALQASFGESSLELSCYSPKTDVAAGGSLEFNTLWTFVPLEKSITDPQQAAALRETLAKAAAQ